jgi:hypothetical protein
MRQETPNILDNVLPLNAAAPAPPTTTLLALAAITNDGGTQMRAGMNAEKVKEYEEVIADADAWPFPALVVFHDGAKYWLADGFHRLNAAYRSGKFAQLPAEIKAGTRRDAVLYAAGANATHGLPRTKDDRRRAVETLVLDDEWGKWSNREIARRCAVDEKFVRQVKKDLGIDTADNPQYTHPKTGETTTMNTAKIGANRPPRLFLGDLKGLVAKWMGMHWQHAWPDNPSHTNGEFWRSLVAWMHENVRETWQEGDLKEAIKALHWLSRPEPQPAASAPSQQIAPATGAVGLLAVWELEKVAREVSKQVYGDKPQPFALNDMRQGARMRQGRFWLLCVQTINANNWRHADLAQAIHNVAEQMAQRATDDLHTGAGRTPPPPLTVAEIVEELTPHLAGFAPGNIASASIGAKNDVAERCVLVLSDFTYQQADLYRALQRISNERHLAMSKEASAPVVNGERPLPDWAAEPEPEPATVAQTVADVVEVYGEPEPVAVPAEALPVSQRSDYESDEWYTPQEYIDAAREVMGAIELDPASSDLAQSVVQATKHLTRAQDGLAMKIWLYQRIWLNPPYSNPAPWIEKLVREHQAGPYCSEAIVLVNNATETSWFQLLLENFPVCLPARRLAFWRHDHANVGARQGQAFFYLGPNADKFEQVFKRFGPILRRIA